MKIKSYPKINIGLKIFKDKNGEYKHKIDSIFYLITKFYDIIEINPSSHQSVTYFLNDQKIEINDCIIIKTLNYLKTKHNLETNYAIKVYKNIPIGSGLGGPSSNAATVINYVLSKNKPIALNLKDIALNLGSDIPFFLTQYPIARVKRYGEYVAPLMHLHFKIHLIMNKIECSTKKIFELLDNDQNYKSNANIDETFKSLLNNQHKYVISNDLTKYIIESNKKLQELADANPDYFFTGSGGTLVRIEVNNNEN